MNCLIKQFNWDYFPTNYVSLDLVFILQVDLIVANILPLVSIVKKLYEAPSHMYSVDELEHFCLVYFESKRVKLLKLIYFYFTGTNMWRIRFGCF